MTELTRLVVAAKVAGWGALIALCVYGALMAWRLRDRYSLTGRVRR